MEIFKNEKEFILHDKMKAIINRNDFDELGSILEIEMKPNENTNTSLVVTNIFAISFYDYNKVQLSQNHLILLTNQESVFFDNVLLLSNTNNQAILLKLLNKEIHYVKMFVSTNFINMKKIGNNTSLNCTQVIDVYSLEKQDLNALSDTNQKSCYLSDNLTEKNEHINLIFEELNQVNLSLINEKEKIEKSKQMIKSKEDHINSLIIGFKKEIMIHSDKFYNEASAKFSNKINEIQKKLQITENNVLNKYKIVREKLIEKNNFPVSRNKSNLNIDIGNIPKEKLANLEIKNKFLEDTINNLKAKLMEKEDVIKTSNETEEKLNKIVKKSKDEIYNLQNKIKIFEEKSNEIKKKEIVNIISNRENKINVGNISTMNNKVKQKNIIKNKFELTKQIVNDYMEYFIVECLISCNRDNQSGINLVPINEKEISMCSNIFLQICINPINLFHKFPFSFVFPIKKISTNIILNSNNKNLLKESLLDLINYFPDIKKQLLSSENDSKQIKNNSFQSLLNLDIVSNDKDQIYLNEIILSKLNSFSVYLSKNEKKYLEKNNYALYKILTLSIIIYKLILQKDLEEILSLVKYVLFNLFFTKDFFSINYLVFSLNYFDVFTRLLNPLIINSEKYTIEFYNIFIDSILFLYSLDSRYNIFEQNRMVVDYLMEQTNILNYIEQSVNKLNSKFILFGGILSDYSKKEIKFSFKGGNPEIKINDEVLIRNLKKII